MRSLLLLAFLATSAEATFGLLSSLLGGGGCGCCCGGGIMGGGMDYGSTGYGGSYGGGMGMNAPGSFFQPMMGGVGQSMGVQSYFTPADGGYGGGYGGGYDGSYGSSYGGSYGSPMMQASYMPQSSGGYVRAPSYRRPLPVPRVSEPSYQSAPSAPPPPPPPPPPQEEEAPATSPPQETGYVQPSAAVRPYESVPHASVETPAETANEQEDYSETEAVTQATAPAPTTNYPQTAAQETNQVHMINTPEEAGYRKVLKRRLVRKKTVV